MPKSAVPRYCLEDGCGVQPQPRYRYCPQHSAQRRQLNKDASNARAIAARSLQRSDPRCVECGEPVVWVNRDARPPRRCPEHRAAHKSKVHGKAKRARAAVRLQKRQSAGVTCGEDGCNILVPWVITRYVEFCDRHKQERVRRQERQRAARRVQENAAARGYIECSRCGVFYHPIRTWVPAKPCPDCRKELAKERARNYPGRRENERAWRRRNRDKVRHKSYARRVAMTSADAEFVEMAIVAARDDFCCGICGNDVDITLEWPHTDSATLDHIIPISHAGPHTYANVRLAHSGCNSSRGNRGEY